MGIELQTVKLLLLAKAAGVDFENTLTIGRQDLLISASDMQSTLASFGEHVAPDEANKLSGREDRFSAALFQRLGAKTVDALDISDFEGASLVHDLNEPIPARFKDRFSVVFDGGTLEHIFNCPVALKNYMLMPKVGGHLIIAVPSNNEMGHGFYQFSPELFFRTLCPSNGYRLSGIFLVPMFSKQGWLRVSDPAVVARRAGFNRSVNSTYLFVVAQRTSNREAFSSIPQQSDYSAHWSKAETMSSRGHRVGGTWRERVASLAPQPVLKSLLGVRNAFAAPDGEVFKPFIPEKEYVSLSLSSKLDD